MQINSRTRLLGVMGWPIEHTLSPLIQNAAIRALGLNWVYTALPVPPDRVAEAIAGARAMGFVGMNVTYPHKAAAVAGMDELSPEAAAIGAINTIHFTDRGAIGYNTDVTGFTRTLTEDACFDVQGKTVLQLGAGGAGHAMVAGQGDGGAGRVIIFDVRLAAAAELAEQMGKAYPNTRFEALAGAEGIPEAAAAADLIANATPLGMKPGDPSVIDEHLIQSRHVVFDAVYRPFETPLLKAAARRGARTVSGLGMLGRQGCKSLAIWSGMQPDESLMLGKLKEALEGKE